MNPHLAPAFPPDEHLATTHIWSIYLVPMNMNPIYHLSAFCLLLKLHIYVLMQRGKLEYEYLLSKLPFCPSAISITLLAWLVAAPSILQDDNSIELQSAEIFHERS